MHREDVIFLLNKYSIDFSFSFVQSARFYARALFLFISVSSFDVIVETEKNIHHIFCTGSTYELIYFAFRLLVDCGHLIPSIVKILGTCLPVYRAT